LNAARTSRRPDPVGEETMTLRVAGTASARVRSAGDAEP
jgi:hypothetical protein